MPTQKLIDDFLDAMRAQQVGIVMIVSQALRRPDNTPFRRDTTHTNLPDEAVQVLLGNLIATDGAAVEAVARKMLELLNASGGPGMTFEQVPEDMKKQLTAGAQALLEAAVNSGGRGTKKDAKPAIIT